MTLRIGILGVNFGWGPHAALESILREIRHLVDDCHVVGFGSEYGRTLLTDVVDEWCPCEATDYSELHQAVTFAELNVALVALEGFAARTFEEAGVPTVFLDLMPFLWRSRDLVVPPREVSRYLAMNLPGLPQRTLDWMRTIRHLDWIGAVVREPDEFVPNCLAIPARDPDQAVVTLGGLLGMTMTDTETYPRLVLPGILDALVEAGFDKIVVAGNIELSMLERIVAPYRKSADFRLGPLSRDEYLPTIGASSLCLSQPGLMSLLEASRCGTPLIRLPPQNVAGFDQAAIHQTATGTESDVHWPSEVLDVAHAQERAMDSEADGNEYVYTAIFDALTAHRTLVRDHVRSQVAKLIPYCANVPDGVWRGLVEKVGTSGATDCAAAVLDLAGTSVATR